MLASVCSAHYLISLFQHWLLFAPLILLFCLSWWLAYVCSAHSLIELFLCRFLSVPPVFLLVCSTYFTLHPVMTTGLCMLRLFAHWTVFKPISICSACYLIKLFRYCCLCGLPVMFDTCYPCLYILLIHTCMFLYVHISLDVCLSGHLSFCICMYLCEFVYQFCGW